MAHYKHTERVCFSIGLVKRSTIYINNNWHNVDSVTLLLDVTFGSALADDTSNYTNSEADPEFTIGNQHDIDQEKDTEQEHKEENHCDSRKSQSVTNSHN